MKKTIIIVLSLVLVLLAFTSCEEEIHVHTWDEGTVTKEASCKKEGVKVFHCTTTGCQESKTEAIEKTPHIWIVDDETDADGWKVTKEATAEEEGSKERVCSVCGDPETAVIEKLTPVPTTKPNDPQNTATGGANTPSASGTAGNTVNTGDNNMAVVYVVIIAAAACAAGALVVVRRRKTSH